MKNKSGWMFGLLMILILLIIFFIIGLSVGLGSQGNITLTNDTLSAWVSALATVVIAILTIFLAKETWELRQVQLSQIEQIRKNSIKPNIDIFLKSTAVSFNFIDVHIVNNGAGVAQNIKFNFSNKNPDALDVYQYINEIFNKLSILNNGISSLASGEKRTSYVLSFIELHRKFSDKALKYQSSVDITYQDSEGKSYSSCAFFNFSEYDGITEFGGGDPLYKISSTLESIKKDIEKFFSGYKRLKADIYTSDDRKKEIELQEERRKKTSSDSPKEAP